MNIKDIEESELKNTSAEAQCLQFQLELLREELKVIDNTIARLDNHTQMTKNWAVVTWVASVGAILSKAELRPFLGLTAMLPLMFWFIDGNWRRLQKRSAYRAKVISQFINDGRLLQSFREQKVVDFYIFDPIGSQHKNDAGYLFSVSLRRALMFKSVWIIYWALTAISIALSTAIYLSVFPMV